ncbi:AraC family transcriptional regulator [Bosea sp. 685]|uniref:AraC family transcriptional regulator n=1 Tax=Bosea sp. 685 TaxID=3080057 RepID=UPI0028929FF4|nr:AraC family transcriptional regulator [Bosea sp. 685]WNJ93206.1 AraC family transcriptional regulator [Bosea sp. 685]
MAQSINEPGPGGLERSCGPSHGDWLRAGPGSDGIERIEAFFSGHAYDPHRHDTYALGLTLSGVQSFDYRGSRQDSRAGNAIVLHPDEIHNGRAGVESGFRYRMLYLEPRLLRAALGDEARALPFISAAVSSDPRLVRAIARGLRAIDAPLAADEAEDIVLGLAEALLALDPSAARPVGSRHAQAASERVRRFLDAQRERVVTSGELEAVAGLDRFALARHFRASFGTSPYNYLVMRRLDRARAMLRSGLEIADVAAACGFADQSHLTRQFRRAFGVTPGRWRNLHRHPE